MSEALIGTPSIGELQGGLLGPIPVVMKYLRAMRIRDIIDTAAPP